MRIRLPNYRSTNRWQKSYDPQRPMKERTRTLEANKESRQNSRPSRADRGPSAVANFRTVKMVFFAPNRVVKGVVDLRNFKAKTPSKEEKLVSAARKQSTNHN